MKRTIALLTILLIGACWEQHLEAVDESVDPTGICAWASVVRVGCCCTGVVVAYADLVLTAGHCMDDLGNPEGSDHVYFGDEPGRSSELSLEIDYCKRHPDGRRTNPGGGFEGYSGPDIGYCILKEPVFPGIRAAPVMVPGCESNWLANLLLRENTKPDVVVVGVGCYSGYSNFRCNSGIKRAARLSWKDFRNRGSSRSIVLEDPENLLRSGDSGAPMFIRMPDDSWRLIGIHHGGFGDESSGEAVPSWLQWLERSSGRDITPCHEFIDDMWVYRDDPTCVFRDPCLDEARHTIFPPGWLATCNSSFCLLPATECSGWNPSEGQSDLGLAYRTFSDDGDTLGDVIPPRLVGGSWTDRKHSWGIHASYLRAYGSRLSGLGGFFKLPLRRLGLDIRAAYLVGTTAGHFSGRAISSDFQVMPIEIGLQADFRRGSKFEIGVAAGFSYYFYQGKEQLRSDAGPYLRLGMTIWPRQLWSLYTEVVLRQFDQVEGGNLADTGLNSGIRRRF